MFQASGLHCCRLFWFNLHVYQWYRYQTTTQLHHHTWLVSQEYGIHPSHSMNFVGFPGFPNHLSKIDGHNHHPKLPRRGFVDLTLDVYQQIHLDMARSDGNGGLTVVITKGSTFMKNEHLVEWFCWISCDIPINPARFNNIPHLGPLGRCSSSTTGMKSCWTHAVEKWKACCSSGSNPFLLNLTWGRFCWWECCPWIQQTDYFWKWAWGMRNEMMWNANTMQSPTHKTKDKHNFDSPRWLLKDGCKMFQLTLPWTRPCQFSESMTRLYFLGDYTCYIVLRHHCVYITCTFDHMFSLSEA